MCYIEGELVGIRFDVSRGIAQGTQLVLYAVVRRKSHYGQTYTTVVKANASHLARAVELGLIKTQVA